MSSEEIRRTGEDSDFLKFATDAARADIHALRYTFISNLTASGIYLTEAREGTGPEFDHHADNGPLRTCRIAGHDRRAGIAAGNSATG